MQTIKITDAFKVITPISKINSRDFLREGAFPIISQDASPISGYWNNEIDVMHLSKPVIVFGDHTRVVKFIDFDFVVGADGVKIFEPLDTINPKYLYYWFYANPIKSLGYARHYRILKDKKIFVPPLPDQQRIVEKLDKVFNAVDQAITLNAKNIENTHLLFTSLLSQLLGSHETTTIPLDRHCDFQGGSQPPKSNFVFKPQPGFVRFLQIRDFKKDIEPTFIPVSNRNKVCNEDDVMIGRYGASVGNILRGKAGAYNVALMKTIPDTDYIDKDFLYYYLSSDLFQVPLLALTSRSAQDGFNKNDLSTINIQLPSLSDQKSIAQKLLTIQKSTTALKQNLTLKRTQLESLKNSLISDAYTQSTVE